MGNHRLSVPRSSHPSCRWSSFALRAACRHSFGVTRRPASRHSYVPLTILSSVRTPSSIASRFAPLPSPRIMYAPVPTRRAALMR